MEEYARCPYLFFLKRIIGLQEWEEPEAAEAMDPLKRGSAVHSMLERFVRDYGGARLATEPRETLQRVLAGVARQELEAARPPGIPDLLWELECEGVQELLRNWLDFERNRTGAGMEPCAVEHVFGTFPDEEVRPAVRIEAGRHVFEFRGRIDRVDVSPDGRRARVIDYKTGSLPKTMEKPSRPAIMAGEKIQVAVYRAAVLASGCWPSLGEIEGEYLHLQPQNKAVVPCEYDDGRLQQGMERLGQILEVVGDGLCRGVFFARTAGTVYKENCKFCGYKIICGKDVARRDELKSGDPEVARFRRACAADIESEEP
jgi:RecB family exonuclease